MMIVTDYYTKYTRVFPLRDHKAATCAMVFVRGWVLYLGVPLMLHSDQGREFESDLWQEMCHYLAICKIRTNPYRPQSDGQVERFNRTLVQVLKPLVNENMDDWDEQVEFVVHAYNSTVLASTNCALSHRTDATLDFGGFTALGHTYSNTIINIYIFSFLGGRLGGCSILMYGFTCIGGIFFVLEGKK